MFEGSRYDLHCLHEEQIDLPVLITCMHGWMDACMHGRTDG